MNQVLFEPAYIALCREAKLQRLVQYGDYYLAGDGEDWRRGYFPVNLWSNKFPEYYREAYSTIRFDEHGHPAGDFLIWLPRLDQLIDLLGQMDIPSVLFEWSDVTEDWYAAGMDRDERGLINTTPINGFGSSREEAALRLLLAERSRKVEKVAK